MSERKQLPEHPNLLLIVGEQERATQHFPDGWEEKNLPNLTRLKRHGLNFANGFCNTSMCTPSRCTLFTGLYPAQHGCVDTLSDGGVFSPTETELAPTIPNLAHMLRSGGYQVHYRGKWHMSKGQDGTTAGLSATDVAAYGFEGWLAPDAGEDVQPVNFGGGYPNHDRTYTEQAVDFFKTVDARQPFCLVYAVVNPNDVLAYPGGGWDTYGYTDDDLGDIELPPTVDEDLANNNKPAAQVQSLVGMAGLGVLGTPQRQKNYLNFYGNLLKQTDSHIGRVLDALDARRLTDSTLVIRTADHGEMGMAHGGLRQKIFNVYEETMKIPFVFSNPILFPEAQETHTLASLVDLMPTIAALSHVAPVEGLQGKDLSSIVEQPDQASPVQEEIVFTYSFPNSVVDSPNTS